VRIGLAPAGSADDVLAFRHPVPYTEDEVAKLAPAASPTGWLAVDLQQAPGVVWGVRTGQSSDRFGVITLEVSDPGVVRVAFAPFHTLVVFAGRWATSPDDAGDAGLTARLASALGKELAAQTPDSRSMAWRECLALGMLARMVLEDRQGGTLLVVPDASGVWLDSLEPFRHQFLRADTSIRDSILAAQHQDASGAGALTRLHQTDVAENVKAAMLAAFSQVNWHPESVLRPIARLAGVDGAVVLTANLDVLGFGAMISVESAPEVYLVKPGHEQASKIQIEEVGGARHQSAVRFVGQNRQCTSLVISHDGHLSLAHWSTELDGVTLLRNAEWWL
jgi:hypothetical protein